MRRCLELIRVSTESQALSDRASIPSQRAINRRTAQAHDLKIVRSVEISDVSGTAVLKCPEILEMLEWIKDPEIHGVVAREFSRLMRPEDFSDYYILQVFADTKTVLYLPEGPIDFSNKMGRVYGVMQAAWAGAQRIEFLENGWNSKELKRKNGGFSQSPICLPFGVAYKEKWTYTVDAERVKEMYRLFLSGETSYTTIGRKVGVESYNVKVILKNPIYTGWRVVDKKRDMSPAGKYVTKNGRQGDRRKIQRAPEDVIRVKVLEPLISEEKFNQAQRLIELKRKNAWHSKEGYEHRFTYNGFLLCGACRGLIYTKYRRDDYYICKARCGACYQRRDRLEPLIDTLFARKLVATNFAVKIVRGLRKRRPQSNVARIQAQLESLTGKRQRILDSYFEGVISPTERDTRLAEIEREKKTYSDLLLRDQPQPELTAERLKNLFRNFVRYDRLKRDSKRKLLAGLTAEIVVSDYTIHGMYFSLNQNRRDKGSFVAARIWLPIGLKAA